MMKVIKFSVNIKAHAETVFGILSDLREAPLHSNVVKSTYTPRGKSGKVNEMRIGDSVNMKTVVDGKQFTNEFVLEGYEPNRRIMLSTKGDYAATMLFEIKETKGTTKLSCTIKYDEYKNRHAIEKAGKKGFEMRWKGVKVAMVQIKKISETGFTDQESL